MRRALTMTVAAGLAGLTLTGCQGDSGTPSTASPPTSSMSPQPTAKGSINSSNSPPDDGARPSGRLLTTKTAELAAEGRNYTTLYTVGGYPVGGSGDDGSGDDGSGDESARIGVLAIRSDGSAVIDKRPRPATGSLIAQSQVGILTSSGRTLLPPQPGPEPRQAIAAAAEGQAFVWYETKSTDFSSPWKVFGVLDVAQRKRPCSVHPQSCWERTTFGYLQAADSSPRTGCTPGGRSPTPPTPSEASGCASWSATLPGESRSAPLSIRRSCLPPSVGASPTCVRSTWTRAHRKTGMRSGFAATARTPCSPQVGWPRASG